MNYCVKQICIFVFKLVFALIFAVLVAFGANFVALSHVKNAISADILPSGISADVLPKNEQIESVFAIIKENAVMLDDQLNPITTLPATYFVVVEGLNQTQTHYQATYANLSGLVDKNLVEVVDYEPKTKFHTAYFTAKNDTFPTNIRVAPTSESAVATTIPLNSKAYMFGFVDGQTLIGSMGSTWYFVEFEGVFGYCYCAHGIADSIAVNVIEKVEKEVDLVPEPTDELTFEWTYILFGTIPAVIVMLALFSRPKKETESF